MRDAEFRGNFASLLDGAADQRDDLDAADDFDGVQVLLAKCDSSGSSGIPLTRDYMLGRQTRSRDSALAAA